MKLMAQIRIHHEGTRDNKILKINFVIFVSFVVKGSFAITSGRKNSKVHSGVAALSRHRGKKTEQ